MNALKQFLKTQRTVFVAGMLGVERYNWFQNMTALEHHIYIPSRELEETVDIPLFFFASQDQTAWAELQSGELVSLPLSAEQQSSRIMARYIPVAHEWIPDGFVIILLPPFIRSVVWGETLSPLIWVQEQGWLQPGSRLLWIDRFPYAEQEGLNSLRRLMAESEWLDTTVCLLRTDRRYGHSDLDDEQQALETARRIWMDSAVPLTVQVLDARKSRRSITSLLYAHRSYAVPIKRQIRDVVEGKHAHFRKFYNEDYDLMVMSEYTADAMESIFSYTAWLKSDKSLIEEWNEQAQLKLIPKLNVVMTEFVDMQLNGTGVYDLDRLMQIKLEKIWKYGFSYIRSCFSSQSRQPDDLGELQYLASTAKDKAQYIQAFQHVMENILRKELEDMLEKHYGLWSRMA
ncbi:hypothetical protein J2W91_004689 [Paenibacillus amylolyticus]|uniref:Uncharacterized protein n=1 Tax=Paenibacillus amylolyticus TaxID=1451 RepID=A0AAP5LR32_PAEAM|nr:hypothetical protein [Paenibacillus amylolyticus]MDR6726183.1 hypothetical protein [Paenibacillus amylolyticus]